MDRWGAGSNSNCYYLKAPREDNTAGTALDYATMTAQSNGMASMLGFGFANGSPFPTHTTDSNGAHIGAVTYPAG